MIFWHHSLTINYAQNSNIPRLNKIKNLIPRHLDLFADKKLRLNKFFLNLLIPFLILPLGPILLCGDCVSNNLFCGAFRGLLQIVGGGLRF